MRLIDSCITQLEAQGPSRTCTESKEEEEEEAYRVRRRGSVALRFGLPPILPAAAPPSPPSPRPNAAPQPQRVRGAMRAAAVPPQTPTCPDQPSSADIAGRGGARKAGAPVEARRCARRDGHAREQKHRPRPHPRHHHRLWTSPRDPAHALHPLNHRRAPNACGERGWRKSWSLKAGFRQPSTPDWTLSAFRFRLQHAARPQVMRHRLIT